MKWVACKNGNYLTFICYFFMKLFIYFVNFYAISKKNTCLSWTGESNIIFVMIEKLTTHYLFQKIICFYIYVFQLSNIQCSEDKIIHTSIFLWLISFSFHFYIIISHYCNYLHFCCTIFVGGIFFWIKVSVFF